MLINAFLKNIFSSTLPCKNLVSHNNQRPKKIIAIKEYILDAMLKMGINKQLVAKAAIHIKVILLNWKSENLRVKVGKPAAS